MNWSICIDFAFFDLLFVCFYFVFCFLPGKMQMDKSMLFQCFSLFDVPFFHHFFCFRFFSVLKVCFLMFHVFSFFLHFFKFKNHSNKLWRRTSATCGKRTFGNQSMRGLRQSNLPVENATTPLWDQPCSKGDQCDHPNMETIPYLVVNLFKSGSCWKTILGMIDWDDWLRWLRFLEWDNNTINLQLQLCTKMVDKPWKWWFNDGWHWDTLW